jgi:hypothetical protein
MRSRVGRHRTFDPALVPLALERRERTGETWREIARDLGVRPVTLRPRTAEALRGARNIAPGAVHAPQSGRGRGGSPCRR